MAKDLPVTVKNRKSGKKESLKTIKMKTNNDLSKAMEADFLGDKAPLNDPDGYVKRSQERGSGRMDRVFRSGAKGASIKNARRGKARK